MTTNDTFEIDLKNPISYQKESCTDKLINDLSKFKTTPVIDDFIVTFKIKNVSLNDNRIVKLNAIRESINDFSSHPECLDLMEYNDWLRTYGRNHIFLFKTKSPYLTFLKNKNKLIENNKVFASAFYNKICLNNTDTSMPVLTKAEYLTDKHDNDLWLRLTWIETRKFEQPKDNFQFERTTNFFDVNLKTGIARLELQKLHNKSMDERKNLFGIYKNKIAEVLNIKKFEIIQLEPLMKYFFKHKLIEFTHFKIKTPKGIIDYSAKHMSATWIDYLPLRKSRFIELNGYIVANQNITNKQRVNFHMDGENNCISFNAITDITSINLIVGMIVNKIPKSEIKTFLKNKYLQELAKKKFQFVLIFMQIDEELQKSSDSSVTSHYLVDENKFDLKVVNKMFLTIKKHYPNKFSVEKHKSEINNRRSNLMLKYNNMIVATGVTGIIERKTENKSQKTKNLGKVILHTGAASLLSIYTYIYDLGLEIIMGYMPSYFEKFITILKIILAVILLIQYYGPNTINKWLQPIAKIILKFLDFFEKKPDDIGGINKDPKNKTKISLKMKSEIWQAY